MSDQSEQHLHVYNYIHMIAERGKKLYFSTQMNKLSCKFFAASVTVYHVHIITEAVTYQRCMIQGSVWQQILQHV